MANAVAVSDASFDTEVLAAERPVLVDFWATWCGPCRAIAPIVEEIAAEEAHRLRVVKLDVDQNGQTAMRFGIQSIPTLILFKGGQPVEWIIGARTKRDLIAHLEPHLAS
jgi:thioredoxin 1